MEISIRRNYFIDILLVGLIIGCGNQDKPKECKDAVIDTVKTTLQDEDSITKKTVPNIKKVSKDEKQQKQLPKIILIITSQACHCVLERCSEGEKIVNEVVQQFPKKLTFEKLDYAKEQTSVTQLTREYQLHFLPALLFF